MEIFLSWKFFILYIFLGCGLYVHFRGKERHTLLRQLFNYTTFLAPYNCFIYATSKVANKPYLPVDTFPEAQQLQKHWQVFKQEAQRLIDEGYITKAATNNDIAFRSFYKKGWKRFYLKWYDDPMPSAKELCPRSTELVSNIPGVNAAMFTLLPAGAKLSRHRDPFAGSMRYHLGLITPNSDACAIFVDGQKYAWRDGEGVIFDETFMHWVKNNTDQDRLIFFCDLERPLRYRWATKINQWFKRFVLRAAKTQNVAGEKVGGINKAFNQIYKIRTGAEKIKKRNKKLYYVLKWGVYLGLFYLIFIF